MQIHDPNLHQQLIEMCDCYLDTDFSEKLAQAAQAPAADDEQAVKYLALALLAAITRKARKLSLKRKGETVAVTVKDEQGKSSLPAPTQPLFAKIMETVRSILDITGDEAKTTMALGLRSGDLELQVKVKRSDGGTKESVKFELPRL